MDGSGTDICLITCPKVNAECQLAGGCSGGECRVKNKADGAPCDDRDIATTDDACESGACIGRDRCDNIQCDTTECRQGTKCDSKLGKCVPGDAVKDGTLCNKDMGLCIDSVYAICVAHRSGFSNYIPRHRGCFTSHVCCSIPRG